MLLVVEGGPVTLTVVSEAVDKGTPVVVIDGSGRMADVISCVVPPPPFVKSTLYHPVFTLFYFVLYDFYSVLHAFPIFVQQRHDCKQTLLFALCSHTH